MYDWQEEADSLKQRDKNEKRLYIGLWLFFAIFLAAVALLFVPKIKRAFKESGVIELLEKAKAESGDRDTALVCFLTRSGNSYGTVQTQVKTKSSETRGHEALNALLKGPEDKNLTTAIPQKTELRGFTYTQGRAFVDLSSEFDCEAETAALAAEQIRSTLLNCYPDLVETVIMREGTITAL